MYTFYKYNWTYKFKRVLNPYNFLIKYVKMSHVSTNYDE